MTGCINVVLGLYFFLLYIPQTQAQNAFGSPYSVFGIGDLKSTGFTQNSAMGGTGIGLRPITYVNPTNPAAYTAVGYPLTSIFDIGFNVSALRLENSRVTENIRDGSLSHLSLWFRYSPKAAGMVGLVPYSDIGYNLSTVEPLVGTANSYQLTRSGQGGLNKFYFGNAFQLTKNLSVGANLSYIFGQIEQAETVVDPSRTIDDFTIERDIFMHQLNVDIGIQYQAKLGEENTLTIGAIYEKSAALSESSEGLFRDRTDSIFYEELAVDEYVIPAKYGLGISFQNSQLAVAADLTHQQWSNSDFENDASLRNSSRFSLGGEFTPNVESLDYLPRITFRAGAFYQSAYLNVNQKDIDEHGFTAGLSLPTSTWGSVNIGYQFSQRGTTLNNLIKETNHQFSVGLTAKNIWFRKKKFK
ncbi:MAG: hypothetical protein ACPGJS_20730 [Flammeovirgaceae bacterium]